MAAGVFVVERRRGTGVLAAIVGSVVGSVALASLLWVMSAPDETNELGAYHDPNAGVQPITAMAGWFLGGLLGVIVALVALGYRRAERAALVVLVLDAVVAPILAVLAAFLIPYGGAPVLVPVLVGWTIGVPAFARLATRPPVVGTARAIALVGGQDPRRPVVLARGRDAGGASAPKTVSAPQAPIATPAEPPGALSAPRLGGVDPARPPAGADLPPGPPIDATLPAVVLPMPAPPPPAPPAPPPPPPPPAPASPPHRRSQQG